MEHRLGEMISRDRQPRVGITVSAATISLRITAVGDRDEACAAMIQRTRSEILDLVPEYYFGDGEEFEQYHAIDAMLRERNESMMVIELGRAAPLGDWFASLGETPGYRGGLSLATVDDLKNMYGAASGEEAIEKARESFGVDWVLLVDAYPLLGKSSDTPQAAADVRFVVAASDGKCFRTKAVMGGHPAILQPRIAKVGMAWMRKILARR
jgi:nicotinamide-nucleotide amidase